MALERITHLTAPPVVGRWYLVPTVEYSWLGGRVEAWPVFLPKHDDREHLRFPWPHYHVDPRFLRSRHWQLAITERAWRGQERRRDDHAFAYAQRTPLAKRPDGVPWRDREDPLAGTDDLEPHGPVTWRRMRCARAEIPYQHGLLIARSGMVEAYAGRTCKAARTGWVCPHRNFPLGSIAPDAEGVLTCPLHGLRISAATGEVLA